MPNVQIKQADVESLSRKLDDISDTLTPDERALLLAVFKLASATLSGATGKSAGGSSSTNQTESGREGSLAASSFSSASAVSTMPRLSSGFKDSFAPILSSGLSGVNPAAVDINVGVKW